MPTFIRPPDIAPPQGRYSHGVLLEGSGRRLIVSGQVGVAPDGTLADGLEAQVEQAWSNLFAVLKAAGMGRENIVKTTAFSVVKGSVATHRAMRNRMLGDHAPASTYLEVAGLARPEFLYEVEAEAVSES